MLGAVLAARAVGLEANPRLRRARRRWLGTFAWSTPRRRPGCASPAGMFKYGMRYHRDIGVGAYHDGGLLRGLFNALTAVIAALWHVRLVGFSCVVLGGDGEDGDEDHRRGSWAACPR